MLSIDDIKELHKSGVKVIMRKKCPHPEKPQGEYKPYTENIILYPGNIESELERDINLLHEFIHARDDIILGFEYDDDCRDGVNPEANKTYCLRPYVLGYIKKLYKINDFKSKNKEKDFRDIYWA